MKRVLIFSIVYYPNFVGGAEVAIKEIVDRIPSSEYEFDMITLRFDRELPRVQKIGNVTVYRIGYTAKGAHTPANMPKWLHFNKYFYTVLACLKAGQLHRKKRYDGTWAMMANYAGFAALFFKMRHPKVPFLLTLQEGDPFAYIKQRVSILHPLFVNIFRKADYIQTISNYLADFARAMGAKCPVEVVPNGVNIARFSHQYSDTILSDLRRSLGLQQKNRIVITTSRLVIKNAVGDVIRSLIRLSDNVRFLILGEGELEGDLRATAKRLGVEDRVQFLGFISHKEMPKYLAISDVFVRPALSEGFGLSYIEAMAARLPVVTTPVGGIVDFLYDPQLNPSQKPTGLFCEPRNPESIADKITQLLSKPELKKQIIENAEHMVAERYDWSAIAAKMKNTVFARVF